MKLIFVLSLGLVLISCGANEKKGVEKVNTEVISIHETDSKDTLISKLKIFSDDISLEIVDENILTENIAERLTNPKFCSNGEKLFFTSANFSKIFSYDFDTKKIKEITSGPKIGNKYSISENGKLLFVRQLFKNSQSGKREYKIVETNVEKKVNRNLFSSAERLTSPILFKGNLFFHENDILICYDLNNDKIVQSSDHPFIFTKNNKLFKAKYGKEFQLFEQREDFVSVDYSSDFRYVKCLTKNRGIEILDNEGNFIKRFNDANSLSILQNSNLSVYSVQEDDGVTIKSSELFIGFLNSNKIIEIENNSRERHFNPSWSVEQNKIAYSTNDDKIKIISVNIEK